MIELNEVSQVGVLFLQRIRWRISLKFLGLALVLGVFFVLQVLRLALPEKQSLDCAMFVSKWCTKLGQRYVLGAKVSIRGDWKSKEGCVVVGNHLSWLDPLLFNGIQPSLYVTSTDTKSQKILGRITKMAGCLFVSRSSASLRRELNELGDVLNRGHNLAFFPEATTGDGVELLSFKPALFDLAIRNQKSVQLVATRYLSISGADITDENKDELYFYGEQTFGQSLIKVLGIKYFEVEYLIGPLLNPSDFVDRKDLSNSARNWIEYAWKTGDLEGVTQESIKA